MCVYAVILYPFLCLFLGSNLDPLTGALGIPIVRACIDRQDSPASPGSPSQVLYTIVRGDLPHGTQVAQTAHAASEASGHPPTIVVALVVPDEASLRRIAEALGEHSLTHQLIVEDAGQFAGQAMAIGVTPTENRASVRKVVSALPLVR